MAYLLILPIVLVVNAVRIASIFLYAEWTLAHGGASVATSNTIEAFHHNAGLVLDPPLHNDPSFALSLGTTTELR